MNGCNDNNEILLKFTTKKTLPVSIINISRINSLMTSPSLILPININNLTQNNCRNNCQNNYKMIRQDLGTCEHIIATVKNIYKIDHLYKYKHENNFNDMIIMSSNNDLFKETKRKRDYYDEITQEMNNSFNSVIL